MTNDHKIVSNKQAYMPIVSEWKKTDFSIIDSDTTEQNASFRLDNEIFKIHDAGELLSRFFCIGLPEMQKDITRLLINLNRLPKGLEAGGEIVLLYELFDFINALEEQTTISIDGETLKDDQEPDSKLLQDNNILLNRNIELLEECIQLREELARLQESSLVES